MKKISICVPVYTMENNLGEIFLVEYFSNLLNQSFKDFEIIVSDQSNNLNYRNICDTFSYNLDIKYIINHNNVKNAASNVNNAIRNSTGEIVKLLYVDDFFIDNNALFKIYSAFQENVGKWLINGFTHCNFDKTHFFDTRIPWFGNKYVNGDNTTGNPSTYAVRRECLLEMDENLLWLVDGEYFYRSYYYYGDPIILPDTLVAFREHNYSAFLDPKYKELDLIEREYCIKKYGVVNER